MTARLFIVQHDPLHSGMAHHCPVHHLPLHTISKAHYHSAQLPPLSTHLMTMLKSFILPLMTQISGPSTCSPLETSEDGYYMHAANTFNAQAGELNIAHPPFFR